MIYSRFCSRPAFAVIGGLLAVFAASGVCAAEGRSYPVKGMALDVSTGYRVDQLNWNIAGVPPTPPGSGVPVNVLSELTWTDLEIVEFSVRGRKTVNNVYLRGSLNLGFIHSGENRDSDYAGDNRTIEFSRSDNNGGGGTVWDASLGAGYSGWVLKAGEGMFTLRPLIGFSLHMQDLTITDGYQTIDIIYGRTGPLSGLNSTYRALWMGPWAGVDADFATGPLTVYGSVEMHGAVYRATADWNLRVEPVTGFQHPVSFEHFANAIGVVLSIGADYALADSWSVAASFKHQDWQTFSGTDRTYHITGAVSDTRLNEVNWMSDAFTIGLNYIF